MKNLLAAALMVAALAGSAGCAAQAPTGTKQQGLDPDKAVKFVNCMREQGLTFTYEEGEGLFLQGEKPEKSKLQAAEKACAKFDPAPPGPSVGTEEWDNMLKLAQCLRQHGLKVPEPQPGDSSVSMPQGDDPAIRTAQRDCARYLPANTKRHPE
ncbi:hypothetical protein [Spongiactinospora sp. TRM90649]|uniref:hypothetical protein n=1 Tax=Spongiactinospora sp. TRM90649 TaxID=3031114 RepID=UPI0023F8FE0D|nr:hypothetical protein [Spongiactinospora sp. TRM90649]MDF5757525.1 hypothetical protein [Spongiactinospora sp. TRM90649]